MRLRSRRRLLSGDDGPSEIWPAFTDVMSTLALILFVLVLLSYVRSLVSAKQLDAFERQIASSERQLQTLASALGALLDDADVRANIDTILIQGHTDERGSDAHNWDLSAKRATAVLDYLFNANPALPRSYGGYFAAGAYSRFRPIDPAKTEEAYQKNRRIEIAVMPKDDDIRKVIDDYLRNPSPQGVAPAASGP